MKLNINKMILGFYWNKMSFLFWFLVVGFIGYLFYFIYIVCSIDVRVCGYI